MLQGIINAFSSTLRADQTTPQNHRVQPAENRRDSFAAVMAKVEPGSSEQPSAVQDFMKFQNMSVAEKIRAAYLAAKDLTEEQLAEMSPEERMKIEQMIKDEIKRKLDPMQG